MKWEPSKTPEAQSLLDAPGVRTLDELDALGRREKERDDICKRLSREEQVQLMARHGYRWST